MAAPLVSAVEAAQRLRSGDAILLDVREPFELRLAAVEGALHVPMRQVPARLAELPPGRAILVMCHHGVRSQVVADFLAGRGFAEVANVAGGIDAWACDVDPGIPRY